MLIVDDDATFAEVVAETIQDTDITAIPVSDPMEALTLVEQAPFAAAVVDLVMPGMDGLELAERLRSRGRDLEVVMLTGRGDMHSAVEAIRRGLFDYLEKGSLRPAGLRRAVRAAIARTALQRNRLCLLAGLQKSKRLVEMLEEADAHLGDDPRLDGLRRQLLETKRALSEAQAFLID